MKMSNKNQCRTFNDVYSKGYFGQKTTLENHSIFQIDDWKTTTNYDHGSDLGVEF